MPLATIASLVAERERLRLALYQAINCDNCGSSGTEHIAIGEDEVGHEVCRCRTLAEDVLGDYKPSDLALEKFWDGGA